LEYPQAEMGFALAVTHCISISQGFPFTQITQQSAKFTTRHLIFEFMRNELGATKDPENSPPGYTLEAFEDG
jgi:hypothetical protein